MLDLFFVRAAERPELLWAQHDLWLVWLSVLVAVLAAISALAMATAAQQATTPAGRLIGRGSGALALGGGIWAMHFIGMLAYAVCANGHFNTLTTIVSMLPGVGAAWVALGFLMRPNPGRGALLVSGVLTGAGIGAMHYLGMAASSLAPVMRYDPQGFGVSVLVAVALATLALWIRFGITQRVNWSHRYANVAAGLVMGLAITAMHYTGMAALRLIDTPPLMEAAPALDNVKVAVLVACVAVALSGLVLGVNAGLRYRQMFQRVQQSESRLRAVADTVQDGIIIMDVHGTVQSFNIGAQRILGWDDHEVLGRNIAMCIPQADRADTDHLIQRYLATGDTDLIGRHREVMALRKNGTELPVRLSIGHVKLPGTPLFVAFFSDISQRRAMEDSLRRSEEQLRTLIANIPGTAFRCAYDRDWSMQFVSDAVLGLTGWQAEDFLAGRINFTQLTHPDEVERLWQEVSACLNEDRPYQVEYRLLDRAGQLHWVSEVGRGTRGADGQVLWIDGLITDITASRVRNAEFESTVNALNRAVCVVEFDLTGRVVHANANFLSMMGYTLDEVIGQHHSIFCEPAYVQSPDYQRFWQQLLQGEIEAGEFLRLAKGGRPVWIHATYNPVFDTEGKPFKVMKFATDLSLRRAMEQELRAARDRAEEAAAARSTFLANMSHEIRTPMNAIIGFTDMLLDTQLEASQRKHLSTVHHAAHSMLRLLNDILDTAKLEKGAVELEVQDFSVHEICEQILASLRIQADKKGLDLRYEPTSNVPEHLQGDPLRLQQILLNLLGNAIKFTAQGHVRLMLDYQDGILQIDVEDTGIGIAAEHLSRIFDPFAQADASTTRQFGGTGLGTTISRQLTELMGGTIGVRSKPGVGTTFTVALPLARGQASAPHRTSSQVTLPPLHILAVDDVPHNLELLELHLARDHHQVGLAHDGAEAVSAFQQDHFDVVLMDLQMPGMDGLEATRRIRQWERAAGRRPTPVIALSASVLEQDRRDARAAGMDGFASKPLEPTRLMQEIARVLNVPPVTSPTSPERPPTAQPPATSLAIDWAQGVSLWGSPERLHEALERFLAAQAETAITLQRSLDHQDLPTIHALAHRLGGASGNLGLRTLQQLAQRIEHLAQAAELAALPTWIGQVGPTLAEVQAELVRHTHTRTAPSAEAQRPDLSWTPASRQAAQQAADHLAQALRGSELAQAPLDVLVSLLPPATLAPLQAALDHFDFHAALQHLDALRDHWTATEPQP